MEMRFRAACTRVANMQVSMSAYLRPDQKAVLVPQAWVPAKQSDNSSAVADFKMAGNTLRHLAWGMEDERVAAVRKPSNGLGCVYCRRSDCPPVLRTGYPVCSRMWTRVASGYLCVGLLGQGAHGRSDGDAVLPGILRGVRATVAACGLNTVATSTK